MSDLNVTCPVCDAGGSAIGIAWQDGDGCPYCGTTKETADLIWRAKDRAEDHELAKELSAALIRLAKAEADVAKTARFKRALRDLIEELGDD